MKILCMLLLLVLPAKAPEHLIIKNIGDLQVGESGWINKNAILIDVQKNMWINIQQSFQEPIKGSEGNYRLLWVKRHQNGYEVVIPRAHYEYKPWISGKKYFRWKLEIVPTKGESIYAFNHWRPIIKFHIYPAKN